MKNCIKKFVEIVFTSVLGLNAYADLASDNTLFNFTAEEFPSYIRQVDINFESNAENIASKSSWDDFTEEELQTDIQNFRLDSAVLIGIWQFANDAKVSSPKFDAFASKLRQSMTTMKVGKELWKGDSNLLVLTGLLKACADIFDKELNEIFDLKLRKPKNPQDYCLSNKEKVPSIANSVKRLETFLAKYEEFFGEFSIELIKQYAM